MREEISEILIVNRIVELRGKKVMIDKDLGELYGVPTKRLNEQVKRNLKRFPSDFMFQLNLEEKQWLIENFDHLKSLKFSPVLPYAFTEHGAVMLASVLNSDRAIDVNVLVVRAFMEMRRIILSNTELIVEIEKIKKELNDHGKSIELVFQYFDEFVEKKQKPIEKIGYKIAN